MSLAWLRRFYQENINIENVPRTRSLEYVSTCSRLRACSYEPGRVFIREIASRLTEMKKARGAWNINERWRHVTYFDRASGRSFVNSRNFITAAKW